MITAAPTLTGRRSGRLAVSLAHSAAAIEEVLRLRYQVFGRELGALGAAANHLDQDRFDPYCDHLLVRDVCANRVVGTYRILTPLQAVRIGGFYAEQEFDLGGLAALRSYLLEVGRACVDADYRTGAVIALLWSGLVRYARNCGYHYLMGCGSVPLADGAEPAGRICSYAMQAHLSPPQWRVTPRVPFACALTEPVAAKPVLPALLKGYLRAGAYVCGQPAFDRDFGTADLLMLLPLERISERYANHFDP